MGRLRSSSTPVKKLLCSIRGCFQELRFKTEGCSPIADEAKSSNAMVLT